MLHEISESGWARQYFPGIFAVFALCTGIGAMAADDTTRAADQQPALTEIVVTATRRAENIQDVPLSIAAVTADDIAQRNFVSEEDYLRTIPGVNQVDEVGSSAIVIRGVETSPSFQNYASGPTVATYFGETSTTASAGLTGGSNVDIKLVDIDRVEVLRGPQGTTFGSSSLGGAVRIIPAAPKLDEFGGEIAANYSNTAGFGGSNGMLQGVINIPLIANELGIRAVVYQYRDSGYYRNIAGSDPIFQAAAAQSGAQGLALDQSRVGDTQYTGGRIAALWQPSSDLKLTVTYLNQTTDVDGAPVATQPGSYDQSVFQIAPQQVVRGQSAGADDSYIDLFNVILEDNLGWAGLMATVSHIESGSVNTFPGLFGFDQPVSYQYPSAHSEYSGEIRLTSQLQGPWKYIAGLYAENLKDNHYETYYWNGSAALNPFPPDALIGNVHDNRDEKQDAAYGELSYEFFDALTLTGGARAYRYHRSDQNEMDGTVFGGPNATYAAGEASGTSYKGNLSYKMNQMTLIYADFSQGFRLGKPQAPLPAAACGTDGLITGTDIPISSTGFVKSDSVDDYDIGTKLTLLDRRLIIDADVYKVDWTNVPVTTGAPNPPVGCGLSYVANAAAATSQGIEFQANYYLTKALRVDLGASTVNAKLTTAAPALDAPAGARLPGSPRENGNVGVQYEFTVGGHETQVRADSFYVGSFYGDLAQSSDLKSGGYARIDASTRMSFDKLRVELFAHNISNRDSYTWRGNANNLGSDFGYRLRPRTVGVQLNYAF
jgi:outer membrane receptor protein involved in Fe transport